VDQSLLRRMAHAGGETRFGMLQTIREYGRDQLDADGSADEIGLRHLRYFMELAERGEPHFVGPDQTGWLERFDREQDNVRGALSRAVDAKAADEGLRLAAALWRFWFQRGYLREGRTWLEQIIGIEPDAASTPRAKAFIALGGLTYWLADGDATEAAYESAVRLYRELEDTEAEAEALYNLAYVPIMRGDLDASRKRFEKSLAVARQIGRADLVAKNQLALGIAVRQTGDVLAGHSLVEQAVKYFRDSDDRFQLAWGLGEVAASYHMLGKRAARQAAYLESLGLFAQAGNLPGIGASLETIAVFASSDGLHAQAVRMMAAADALTETTGATAPWILTPSRDVEGPARRAIGDQAVEEALAEGRGMTIDQAIEYARMIASS
jgi:hypothetical protein